MSLSHPDQPRRQENLNVTDRLVQLFRIRLLDVGDPSSALARHPELMGNNIFQAESLSQVAELLYAEREKLTPAHVVQIDEVFRINGGLPPKQSSRPLEQLFGWVRTAISTQTRSNR